MRPGPMLAVAGADRVPVGGRHLRRRLSAPYGSAASAIVSALAVTVAVGTRPDRLRGEDQTSSRSTVDSRDRSCSTALVWIWQTLLSVTPRTLPISAKVRFS